MIQRTMHLSKWYAAIAGVWILVFLASGLGSNAARAAEPVSFNRDVRPILSGKCFQCHGPDGEARKADLRLDVEALATEGKDPVIVRGKPADSRLVMRILSHDASEQMPPPAAKKPLTDAEKRILQQWVAEGARYQKHWAFEPIVRPALPEPNGTRGGIDQWLEKKLKSVGLTPRPEADRETLLRRVAFTLTGLPPTLAEIEQYLADKAPGAYERMVDRYLASPRYGEEMAKHWLDVARYADTHGLHLDNERQMFAYRDWVVKAFNDNLPFDQFTIWQVAGDQLPKPTDEQLIATGFNRCNVTTSEGGSIAPEFTYRYAVERTTAVTQAWLGLTAGCAVCHDHKYDPITAKEFYSLYAFFNNAADPAMDGNTNVTPPFVRLPNPLQKAAAEAALSVERDAAKWLERLADNTPFIDPALPRPSEKTTNGTPVSTSGAATAVAPAPAGSANSSAAAPSRRPIREILLDDTTPYGATMKCSSRNASEWQTDPAIKAKSGRRVLRQSAARAYNDVIEFKTRPVVIPHEASFRVWVWVDPLAVPSQVNAGVLNGKSGDWSKQDAEGKTRLVRDGRPADVITPGEWTQLTLTASDLSLKPGDTLAGFRLNTTEGTAYWDALELRGESDPVHDPLESLKKWRAVVGKTAPPELPSELAPLLAVGVEKELDAGQEAKLKSFWLAYVARPVHEELVSARQVWEQARTARVVAEETPHGTFIYRDLPQKRESFVMLRGQYDKPGEKVEPGVPAVLPPLKTNKPKADLNRLDLAQWLVAPENPLTARVAVNRLWQQVFGTGLVKTSYDFGTQGDPPSHPELIDWLAAEFRDGKWDTKKFLKQLLLSDAFRRDAGRSAEMRALDPANRLLAHGPRFRLDAEQVRDNALFTAGLIDLTVGGRGVKPYQPANIWEPVGYSDSNTRFYLQDHGSSLYRRSLYVFLKRTAPPPFMSNFDAPNREQVCTVRERSNTPLQALQLMNDVQHFEAARALAQRVLREAAPNTDARLSHLYRLVLSREPKPNERDLLHAAFTKQLTLFTADPKKAEQAIRVGESKPEPTPTPIPETAAWTMLANLVLNLDETLNRN